MKQGEKYPLAENIDYRDTGQSSIWGLGDKETLDLLERLPIEGRWLNLAAGDGRYNSILLNKATGVVACDIDSDALSKLARNTPEFLRRKLETRQADITGNLPFNANSFDGILCTGSLHLFPKGVVADIFREMDKVIKPGGRIVIDFATDVRRVLPDGSLYLKENELGYKSEEAEELLKSLLSNYKLEIIKSKVPQEEVKIGDLEYNFTCSFLLISGQKINRE